MNIARKIITANICDIILSFPPYMYLGYHYPFSVYRRSVLSSILLMYISYDLTSSTHIAENAEPSFLFHVMKMY